MTSSTRLPSLHCFLFKVCHLQLEEDEERSNYSVLQTTMRITTAFLAFSITLVMMEFSNARKPLESESFRTSVILSQTKEGLRSDTYQEAASGKRTQEYEYSDAPVYRNGYPLYRCYVALREDRAARISKEEEKLLDDKGNLCLGESSEMKTLEKGIDENLVKYTDTLQFDNGERMTFTIKPDQTVDLQDPDTKTFVVTIRAQYGSPIVAGTTCTQIETTVEAAMVKIVSDQKPKVTTKPAGPNEGPKPATEPQTKPPVPNGGHKPITKAPTKQPVCNWGLKPTIRPPTKPPGPNGGHKPITKTPTKQPVFNWGPKPTIRPPTKPPGPNGGHKPITKTPTKQPVFNWGPKPTIRPPTKPPGPNGGHKPMTKTPTKQPVFNWGHKPTTRPPTNRPGPNGGQKPTTRPPTNPPGPNGGQKPTTKPPTKGGCNADSQLIP